MARLTYLDHISPWGKFFLLIGLIIISSLISAFTGLLIGKLYLNVSFETLTGFISNPHTPEAVNFLKIYQLINQLGIFIIPVILFSFLVSTDVTSYLYLNRKPQLISILVSGLLIYTILPFNNFLHELNQAINFPEMMSGIEKWMAANLRLVLMG